jgi:hypothetical protein
MSMLVQHREYDELLAEAIQLHRRHETRAKDFVPKMYAILVEKEGLTPQDAADRIYKDLAGIWQKDTIRRLLPVEAKNPVARVKQALSRLHKVSNAGSILQTDEPSNGNGRSMVYLEHENAILAKKVEALQEEKKLLLEKMLRLERALAQHRGEHKAKKKDGMTIVMPPHLFVKAFTLMRSSPKPLVLKAVADEVVDVDKMS